MIGQDSEIRMTCAFIPVMLVYRAVLVAPAGVGQVSSDGAFEETLASLARDLTVVLSTALVTADHALKVLRVLAVFVHAVPVRALGHVGGGDAGGRGGNKARAAEKQSRPREV